MTWLASGVADLGLKECWLPCNNVQDRLHFDANCNDLVHPSDRIETCLQSGEGAQKQTHHSPPFSSPFFQFWLGPLNVLLLKDQTYFCFQIWLALSKHWCVGGWGTKLSNGFNPIPFWGFSKSKDIFLKNKLFQLHLDAEGSQVKTARISSLLEPVSNKY